MKYIFTLLILSGILWSCKETSKSTANADDTRQQKEMNEADLGSLYQYYHSNPSTLEQKDENTLIEYAAEKGYSATRTPSGVFVVVQKEGSGDAIKWGDPLQTHYKGYFPDGKEFDSSYSRGEPIKFRVGQMIGGWNEALMGRKKGDKLILLIPSHMGYGKRGMKGFVPPDANLVFEIDILNDK